MNVGRIVRTVRYLKPCQIWFQVWRRVQRWLEAHPKCGDTELPEFTFLNLAVRPKGWNDTSLDMLWRYNLHYFDGGWILAAKNAESAKIGRRADFSRKEHKECVERVWKLMERWIRENPRGSVPGWDPYPTSLRIVNWVKWLEDDENEAAKNAESAKIGRGGGFNRVEHVDHVGGEEEGNSRVDRAEGEGIGNFSRRERKECKEVEGSIREQVAWLERHVEWHIMANHLMANLKALIIGNRYLDRDCVKWMRLYREQIAEQILPDGGHFERSVMYHAIILEDVLDVMKFCGDEAEWLKPVTAKMLRYLVDMTGPDGKIAMFNDAADGIAKSTEWLCEYARSLGIEVPEPEPFADFPDTGYTRMTAGDFMLFVDSGAIGPDYQPGHAHADTLTYELYWKGRKVVTDTGTSEYRGKRRMYERSTAAHNVVEVDCRNSSEVWSSHRVGARARIVERVVEPGRVMAAHDGYGVTVGRVLTLTDEGLTVVEKVEGRSDCVTRVHLTGDGVSRKERKECKEGGEEGNSCEEGKIEEFEYAVEFGKLGKGMCLSWRFDAPGEFTYTIKAQNDILCFNPKATKDTTE